MLCVWAVILHSQWAALGRYGWLARWILLDVTAALAFAASNFARRFRKQLDAKVPPGLRGRCWPQPHPLGSSPVSTPCTGSQESAVIRSVLGDAPASSAHAPATATNTSASNNGTASAPRSALRSGRPPVARRGRHVSLDVPHGGGGEGDASGAGGGAVNGADSHLGRPRLGLDVDAADSEPVPRVAPTPSPLPRAVAGSRGGGGRSRSESARKSSKVGRRLE